MPLNKSSLTTGLTTLFTDPPDTATGCAQGWASALRDYVVGVVPPSTQVATATAVLEESLTVIFSAPVSGAPAMEQAFSVFAVSVGLGMQPAYTATPPPALVGFSLLFSTPESAIQPAVDKFVDAIDAWFRTAQATLNVTPFTVTPWT